MRELMSIPPNEITLEEWEHAKELETSISEYFSAIDIGSKKIASVQFPHQRGKTVRFVCCCCCRSWIVVLMTTPITGIEQLQVSDAHVSAITLARLSHPPERPQDRAKASTR